MDNSDPSKWRLYLVIDDGTSKASVGYQIVPRGEEPIPGDTKSLELHGVSTVETPQCVGITRGRGVVWGHELERQLLDGTLQPEDVEVFTNLKVLLFPTMEASRLQASILNQLRTLPGPEMSMQHLQRLRLNKMRGDIIDALVDAAQMCGWSRAQVEMLETNTTVAVPEMATIAQRNVFQRLLQEAGFQNVKHVSEAEAAALWRSLRCDEYHRSSKHPIGRQMQVAHEAIILDAGGYTAHGVRTQFSGFGKGTDSFTFEEPRREDMIGRPYGSTLSIEERLFELATQHLAEQYGSAETAFGEKLGITAPTFRRVLSRQFESYRRSFKSPHQAPYIIWIDGESLAGGPTHFSCRVEGHVLQKWYNDVWDKIRIEILDVLRRPSVKSLMVAGGFFRNPYLRSKMEAYAKEHGLDMGPGRAEEHGHPDLSVVLGAMYIAGRSAGQPSQMPLRCTLGIDQEEPYSRAHHPELHDQSPLIFESNGLRGEKKRVFVKHRWCKLIDQTDMISTASNDRIEQTAPMALEFLLTQADRTIRKKIYYTTDLSLADHEPIMKDGKLRDGIEEWQEVTMTLHLKELKKYPKIPPSRTSPTLWAVWAWLKLERTGGDIQLSWQLARPDWKPAGDEEVGRDEIGAGYLGTDTLHSSQFPPWLQRNNAPGTASIQTRPPTHAKLSVGNAATSARRNGPQYREVSEFDEVSEDDEDDGEYVGSSRVGRCIRKRKRGGATKAKRSKKR